MYSFEYVNIRIISLPYNVNAVTLPCEDGSFDIYINLNLCPEAQKRAIRHELEHIKKDHFYIYDEIAIQEMIANRATK